MDAAEKALLAETLHAALAPVSTAEPTAVDAVLADLGWRELLAAEPDVALDVVLGALGATGAAATVLDDLLATALGVEPRADLCVLLPAFAAWGPPGRIEDGRIGARGLASARVDAAGAELLVVCTAGEELRSARIPVSSAEVRAVRGIDPDAGWRTVHLRDAAVAATSLDAAAWPAVVARGRRAAARQIAGACRSMLALATAHAQGRVQFGRPIARFQAVRHRLAEALVAIEALESTIAVAAEEGSADTAALAKACAGRTAGVVGTHCQQVLAGIGFTTDHAFHRFLKRTMVLQGLFGTADDVVLEIGRKLLAARRVPTLVEL